MYASRIVVHRLAQFLMRMAGLELFMICQLFIDSVIATYVPTRNIVKVLNILGPKALTWVIDRADAYHKPW